MDRVTLGKTLQGIRDRRFNETEVNVDQRRNWGVETQNSKTNEVGGI